MKAVILAGGRGTRLRNNADSTPKPLVRIGDRPILWHIIRYLAHFDLDDVILALGYAGEQIAQFVSAGGLDRDTDRILSIDTGQDTSTGGRLKRLAPELQHAAFLLTYADGLSDVDLRALAEFHHAHGKLVTMTVVRLPIKFGRAELDGDRISAFAEKPVEKDEWINAGYFIVEPRVLGYIDGDETSWERETLPHLARAGELMAFRHQSYWQCMDTSEERWLLDQLWRKGSAPWKIW
jgi:glucose-1-phosphate cytidylyltransferase